MLAAGASIMAMWISHHRLKKEIKDKTYTELDIMYAKILEIGIEHPEFRDINKTNNYQHSFKGNKYIQYDSYAHMVWNVCETVYDKTINDTTNEET